MSLIAVGGTLTVVGGTLTDLDGGAPAPRFTGNMIAHRGNSASTDLGTRENTIEAMLAVPTYMQGVEIDPRITSDGEVILMHDATVDRTTTGTGAVAALTATQVAGLTTEGGQKVPTLAGFLAACAGRDFDHILVHLQADLAGSTAYMSAALAVVDASPVATQCVFMVNATAEMSRFRSLNTSHRLGCFGNDTANIDSRITAALANNVEFLLADPDAYVANRSIVAQAHTAGLAAGASTADTQADRDALIVDGAEWMLTNVGGVLATYAGGRVRAPSGTPTVDTTNPTTPGSVTATATSSSTSTVTWTASTDASGIAFYAVFRGGAQIATTTGTSYGDSGLTAETGYSYTVRALDRAGNVSAASTASTITTPAAPPGFTPASLGAAVQFWFDANDLGLANGAAVATWPDKSGNGRDATGTAQPAYETVGLNGHPSVHFDGVDDMLKTAALGAPLAQPNWIFLVAQEVAHGATAGDYPFIDGVNTTGRHVIGRSVGGGDPWYMSSGTRIGSAATGDGNAHVFQAYYNSGTSTLTVDSTTVISAATTNTHQMGGVSMGNRGSDGARPLNCRISEVVVLDSATTDDAANVVAYLRAKWGI